MNYLIYSMFGSYVFLFLFHKGKVSYLDYNTFCLQVTLQKEEILISENVIANTSAS